MAVVLNASGVNRVRFTVINNMKSLFHPQREIHYIGGTDILPPPLEPEEEAYVLSQLDTRRSEEAKALLIERNLRLVVYIAKKFENTGIGVEDLISIGTIGLIKAIQTFKLDKKIKLATYASRCIENEILMYLRRTNKTKMEVSIDEPLNVDWDGNELTLSDVLGTEPDAVSELLEDDGWLTGSGADYLELELEDEKVNPKYGILTVKGYLQKARFAPDTTIELAGTPVGIYE